MKILTASMLTQADTSKVNSQRGISLVIVMIFLVILSMLGISAMQSSTFASRIARNESDRNVAFQAAEAALRDAELDISNRRFDGTACSPSISDCRAIPMKGGDEFDSVCTDGRCDSKATGFTPVLDDPTKWALTGAKVITYGNCTGAIVAGTCQGSIPYGFHTGASRLPLVAQQPRYIFEYFPTEYAVVYRITAIGYGANASTQVMLQSSVKAPAAQ